jgi:murein DD-endopeptidase MepM/ murein hydrolase activator NlpD
LTPDDKKKILSDKLRNKYRLVILNDDTFEEKLSLRLSRLNVFVVAGLSAILLIAGTTVIIAFTPLREYVPGYSSTAMKRQAVQNSFRVDSLERQLALNDHYLEIIRGVISGELVDFETNTPDTSFVLEADLDSEVSAQDRLLREDVERESQFDVVRDLTSPAVQQNFLAPVKGIVNAEFDGEVKHFGVDVLAGENEPVLATLDGTVDFVGWSTAQGHVVCIQHADDLFSLYAHNAAILVSVGDRVEAGKAVALIGNSGGETTGPHLHFELWHLGKPLDPEKYISF